jgi:hypothetical protein
MKKILTFIGLATFLFTGCASHKVNPVDKKHNMQYVCIVNNPKVIVKDYIPVVEDIFHEHGIATDIYDKDKIPAYCNVKMKYTVLRKWDLAPFISYANVDLFKNGVQIGYAEYSNKGGFDFGKWGSSKEKITPILEKLLVQYEKKAINFDKSKYKKEELTMEVSLKDKLTEVKKMYKDGLITEEEYTAKRKQLLSDY